MKRLLCLLLATVIPSLAAQDKEVRTIRFRTLCFEFAPGERVVTASGDPTLASKATVELSRRLDSRQDQLSVTAGQVVLGKLGTDAAGKPMLGPMAVARLPAAGSEFLFLLVPSGKEAGEVYRCLVLPDDTANFPPGGFRLINMSHTKLRFAMGNEKFELLPGTIKLLEKIGGVREDGRFAYVAQYQDGETWNRLSTGFWTRRDKIRSVQIAFLDPKTQRLTMRGYDDTLAVVAGGAKPPSQAR
ncbi:MAG: hypothetical protein NTW21_06785 [Verrucomicrobia bacterium]|nr:hypothetical protein [Verrucomicrobiota bacterium]